MQAIVLLDLVAQGCCTCGFPNIRGPFLGEVPKMDSTKDAGI